MITFKEYHYLQEAGEFKKFAKKVAPYAAAAGTIAGLPHVVGPPDPFEPGAQQPPAQVAAAVPGQDANQTDVNATTHSIDWDFIAREEGAAVRAFYVPEAEDEGPIQSGITIASGFDIGQHNANEVRQLFRGHTNIVNALVPFVNVTGQAARNLLAQRRPADLNGTQIQTIDTIVNADRSEDVVSTFDTDNQIEEIDTFNELPPEFQTVIASVTFQYGNIRTETPNFYRQVMTGRWDDVLRNLRNFRDGFPSRRNREADLWEEGLNRIRRPN
tara:strand:+ start:4588 stop:5403 length:816 start_codon:yes stop_codon:yes gene_type:complete